MKNENMVATSVSAWQILALTTQYLLTQKNYIRYCSRYCTRSYSKFYTIMSGVILELQDNLSKVLQIHSAQKRCLRLSLTFDQSSHCEADHCTKCHIQWFIEYVQGWQFQHFPGQSVPMFNNPFCAEILPENSFLECENILLPQTDITGQSYRHVVTTAALIHLEARF